jgi:transposase-like protein
MPKKTSVEKAVAGLAPAEVLQSQGRSVAQACREIGVSEQTLIAGARNTAVEHGLRPDA